MKQLKDRATREELFDADELSVDWETHQHWRVQRTLERGAERLQIPIDSVRLMFTSRTQLDLMNRKGEFATYRPMGVVNQLLPSYGQGFKMLEFEVSWIDAWGYPHRNNKSFMEIILSSTDELSHRRIVRQVSELQRKLRVEPLVQ